MYLLQVCLGIVLLANIDVKVVLVDRSEPKIPTGGGVIVPGLNLVLKNFTGGRPRTWVQQATLLTINNMAGLAMGAAAGLKNVTEEHNLAPDITHFYVTEPQPRARAIMEASNGTLDEDWLYSTPQLVTFKDSRIFHVVFNKNPAMEVDWEHQNSCRKYRYQGNNLSPMNLKICAKEVPLEEHTGLLIGNKIVIMLLTMYYRIRMSYKRIFPGAET